MKKLTLTALTCLLLVAAAAPVFAMGPLDAEASVSLFTKYVWRGMVATPDPVLQPAVKLGVAGLSAGLWGNIDTNDVNGREFEFTETDWVLSYGLSLPKLDLGLGFIHYRFPNSDAESTTELFLSASVGVPLSPSLTFYQDLDQIKGGYWEARLGHSLAIGPTTNLDLTAGLGLGSKGYVAGYFGTVSALPSVPDLPTSVSLTNAFVSAAVPFNLTPFVVFTPSVSYSTLVDSVKDIVGSADGAIYHGATDAVVWGLSATVSF
jgi:hypothetical protein